MYLAFGLVASIVMLALFAIFNPVRVIMNVLILAAFVTGAFGWFGLTVVGAGTYANNYVLWAVVGTIAFIGLLVAKVRMFAD